MTDIQVGDIVTDTVLYRVVGVGPHMAELHAIDTDVGRRSLNCEQLKLVSRPLRPTGGGWLGTVFTWPERDDKHVVVGLIAIDEEDWLIIRRTGDDEPHLNHGGSLSEPRRPQPSICRADEPMIILSSGEPTP